VAAHGHQAGRSSTDKRVLSRRPRGSFLSPPPLQAQDRARRLANDLVRFRSQAAQSLVHHPPTDHHQIRMLRFGHLPHNRTNAAGDYGNLEIRFRPPPGAWPYPGRPSSTRNAQTRHPRFPRAGARRRERRGPGARWLPNSRANSTARRSTHACSGPRSKGTNLWRQGQCFCITASSACGAVQCNTLEVTEPNNKLRNFP